jgi:hypothetical protein
LISAAAAEPARDRGRDLVRHILRSMMAGGAEDVRVELVPGHGYRDQVAAA